MTTGDATTDHSCHSTDTTPERIHFHFDPICPWCYQTSRWIRRVRDLGAAVVTWGLFSLELQNAGHETGTLAASHARSRLALSTAVAVRHIAGPDAVGAFYAAIGRRIHEDGEPLEDRATTLAALEEAGLAAQLLPDAGDGDALADRVAEEHRQLVENTRSFGVPTMVLDAGEGPAIFGPVLTEPPETDEETLELFDHVVWLARYENFSELKRKRVHRPQLESVRRRDQQR
jgi:protein-disulfide isomerase-like protein with CxxC motif